MVRTRREPEPYQRYRAPLQAKWRPFILERDRHRCRNCGARGGEGGADLHVAHITDAKAFVRAAADHRAVTFSYRWDNLYTLCARCHMASHRFRLSEEDQERRWQVHHLEENLRRLRGWSSPFAALPPAMVPARVRPRRSFHDVIRISPLFPFPTYSTYAADGGAVFGDQEAGPLQAALPGVRVDPGRGRGDDAEGSGAGGRA